MTYATLMLHVRPRQSNAASLDAAADLANRFHCAVIGIAACEPLQVAYGDTYVPLDVIDLDRLEVESEMKKLEAEFRRVLEKRVEKLEWRSSIAFAPLSNYLASQAGRADLFITEAFVGGYLSSSRQGGTGDLVMQIGRSALIVPSVGAAPKFERFVIG